MSDTGLTSARVQTVDDLDLALLTLSRGSGPGRVVAVIPAHNEEAPIDASVAAGTGLAMTGLDIMWLLLAAFALVAAGGAFLQLVPRREG